MESEIPCGLLASIMDDIFNDGLLEWLKQEKWSAAGAIDAGD